MQRLPDSQIIGKRFNRLTILSDKPPYVYKGGRKKKQVLCKCDCGKEKIILLENVTSGKSKSCGCFNIDRTREANTTHGMCYTPLNGIWREIRKRCLNKNYKRYADWGGRGITVCKQWDVFMNFHEDMKDGYKKGLQIDRIDNNKGYSKENCRWVTRTENGRNKRNNVLLTFAGKTACVAEWEQMYNLPKDIIRKRIKRGWDTERAITTPK
jgi:hypothetical protein